MVFSKPKSHEDVHGYGSSSHGEQPSLLDGLPNSAHQHFFVTSHKTTDHNLNTESCSFFEIFLHTISRPIAQATETNSTGKQMQQDAVIKTPYYEKNDISHEKRR